MKMEKENKEVEKRLDKYLILTKKALEKAVKAKKQRKEEAEIVIDMTQRYYQDALYFKDKKEFLIALCAVSYAHGWLDCGSKLGFFDVKDSKLFIVK